MPMHRTNGVDFTFPFTLFNPYNAEVKPLAPGKISTHLFCSFTKFSSSTENRKKCNK